MRFLKMKQKKEKLLAVRILVLKRGFYFLGNGRTYTALLFSLPNQSKFKIENSLQLNYSSQLNIINEVKQS